MDGSVVVGSTHARGLPEAYRWTPWRRFEYLGNCFDSESSRADLVSSNGEVVVGGCIHRFGEEVFRWTPEEGMVGLGTLGFGYHTSKATGISGDGSVIVGYSQGLRSAMRGFVWKKSTGMTLFPGETATCIPSGASFDGSTIIGGGCSGADGTHRYGFVWDSVNGLRELDRLLARSRVDIDDRHLIPIAVSGDGQTLAGRILSPAIGFEGWIARLPQSRSAAPPKEGPLPRPAPPGPTAAFVGSVVAGITGVLAWYYLLLAPMSVLLGARRARRVSPSRVDRSNSSRAQSRPPPG